MLITCTLLNLMLQKSNQSNEINVVLGKLSRAHSQCISPISTATLGLVFPL